VSFTTTQQTSRNYWLVLLVRGILAILFGIVALVWPGWTILALIYVFGAYALIDGVMALVNAIQDRSTSSEYWWLVLIRGIIGIIIGLLVFFWPGLTALVLFTLIGIWAVVIGIFELLAAFVLPGDLRLEWTFVLGGILSIILGVIFIRHPVTAMLSLVWVLGIFAVAYGLVQIVHAFRYRSLATT
jgi:uncharacterized membrane protein HdeD (DUF308 family)